VPVFGGRTIKEFVENACRILALSGVRLGGYRYMVALRVNKTT